MTRSIDDLTCFLRPRSIAIIGASRNPDSISGKPLRFLKEHGFAGRIYPVNPKYQELMGFPCYPSIEDVPAEIDLALIAVNYRLVLRVLEDCARKKVKFVTIFSSGFAEAGEEGQRMQQQISALAKTSGMRICGPNCQGSVSIKDHAIGAFSASFEIKPLRVGPVGYVTQSGALGYSIFSLAQEAGVGFSYVVSTGNEVDLHTLDFMEFMLEDPDTHLIISCLEGIKNGRQFLRVADRALELGKPIVTLKLGRSEVGRKAAASHTASLTGSDAVCDAFFRQKGILRVADIEDMINVAVLSQRIPALPQGNGLGIVTSSGGGGILAADAASELNLRIPELGEETKAAIRRIIPMYGSALNPVDVTGQVINDADNFQKVLHLMLDHPALDALLIVITQIAGTSGMRMAKDIVALSKTTTKPIAVAWATSEQLVQEQMKVLTDGGVFLVKSPVRAATALGALMTYGQFRNTRAAAAKEPPVEVGSTPGAEAARRLIAESAGPLSEHEAKQVLERYGLPVPAEERATSAEQAVALAEQIGYPVVLKVDSPDIAHKTEAGGIRLDLRSAEAVATAFTAIMDRARAYNPRARIRGATLRAMIPEGTEVIVGVNNDPQFGPTVVFGLGGIFVEVLKDVSLRIAPLTRTDALAMITEIKGYALLRGARGGQKGDVEALADVLVKVGRMARELEDLVAEIDINPLIVLPEGQGVRVADALIIKRRDG